METKEELSFTSANISSIVCGHRGIICDIDWTKVVARAISSKMLTYYVIKEIHEDGEIKVSEEFLNMTHLVGDAIIEKAIALKTMLGLVSIEY